MMLILYYFVLNFNLKIGHMMLLAKIRIVTVVFSLSVFVLALA